MDNQMISVMPPHRSDSTLTVAAPSESTLSDKEVVARVLSGETECYAILVRRHNKPLNKLLRCILASHDEVEDVMQEAHFRALTHLSQFEGRSSFLTWLSRVMINEAYGHVRRRRVFQLLEPLPETGVGRQKEFASVARNPEQQAIQEELREILIAAMDSLPEPYRVVFTVREIGEKSTADAAAHLGVTEQCVKSRMLRARRLLQKQISRTAPAYARPTIAARSIRLSGVDAKLGKSGLKHDVTSGASSPYVAIRALRA
jgi:RNA polymerase sigma-70 factor (ECF subfamily)